MYRQYVLKTFDEGSESTLVTWLPDEHKGQAIELGTRVVLEGDDNRVWTVAMPVSALTRTRAQVVERAHSHYNYRKHTDI